MPESSEPSSPSPRAPSAQEPVPIVAIGASAGGLGALQRFFEAAPDDGGVAYVVVVHLDPKRESHIADILGRATSMPVREVSEEMEIEPNQVYVISPKSQLELADGTLRVLPLPPETPRLTIDRFFRSVAATRGADAVGVVLSGAGRDGALGLRAMREQGGITATQDPAEAEFPEMPRSAQGAGQADLVLPARELPVQLLRILSTNDVASGETKVLREDAEAAMEEIIDRMEKDVGHNLRHYKRPTILRRLHRRMRFCRSGTIPEYARRIEQDPEERRALFQDLLISVSRFFRDPEAFEALEHDVIPRLFEGKRREEWVRVWVPGCATGEEAYSLSILLHERAAELQAPPEIRIFASDIDEQALAFARRGQYPESIEEDVPEVRLARYFRKDELGYQVLKPLRDSVLFAAQGILTDPPFGRLHLISCRNLLIYLAPPAQREVMERFHYALRPGGHLFLGASESAAREFFEPVVQTQRIYRRVDGKVSLPAPSPGAARRQYTRGVRSAERAGLPNGERPTPVQSIHERILLQTAPPSALVDSEYRVVHLSKGVDRYLRLPAGSPTTDLRDLANEPFASHLRTALHQTFRTGATSRRTVEVELGGEARVVELLVHPGSGEAEGLAVVAFHERPGTAASDPRGDGPGAAVPLRELEAELKRTRDQLRVEIEEREAMVEEFTVANEELQSVNEEHQATTEELETRGEELQSMNEELSTVNQEHQATIEELAEVNAHLANLIESTKLAMIVLDRDLRVRRFTGGVPDLFNILPSDENRPFARVTHHLRYEGDLLEDARRALITEQLVEKEVQGEEKHYIVRLLPYRTAADRVDGVVVLCFDITDRKEIERTAERAKSRAEEEKARVLALMERMPAGVVIVNCASRHAVLTNQRSREVLFPGESAAPDDSIAEHHLPLRVPEFIGRIVDQVVETGKPVLDQQVPLHDRPKPRDLLVSAAPVPSRDEELKECILTLVDIEEILRHAHELEERAERTRGGFLATISHEFRTPLNAIAGYTELLLLGVPDPLTEDQERHVRRLQTCVEQLADMVEQILTLTHLGPGEGGAPVTPQTVDPRVSLEEAATLVGPEATGRGLDLRVAAPDDVSEIVTDPAKLRQILVNLAQNAVKYTPEGEVELRLWQEDDGGVVFEVRDTGVGIAPEHQERIFDRFWRARRADRPVGPAGAGIGLAVVKSLVQLLKGTIEVESELDRGSTFRVRLPATLESPADGGASAPEP